MSIGGGSVRTDKWLEVAYHNISGQPCFSANGRHLTRLRAGPLRRHRPLPLPYHQARRVVSGGRNDSEPKCNGRVEPRQPPFFLRKGIPESEPAALHR